LSWEIEVKLALVNAKAPLRALSDVTLRCSGDEIIIKRCAVFQRDGQPPWANLPGLPIEKNDKRQFVPLVELSPKLKKRVFDHILNAYRAEANER
jgi:hypothetical protein